MIIIVEQGYMILEKTDLNKFEYYRMAVYSGEDGSLIIETQALSEQLIIRLAREYIGC